MSREVILRSNHCVVVGQSGWLNADSQKDQTKDRRWQLIPMAWEPGGAGAFQGWVVTQVPLPALAKQHSNWSFVLLPRSMTARPQFAIQSVVWVTSTTPQTSRSNLHAQALRDPLARIIPNVSDKFKLFGVCLIDGLATMNEHDGRKASVTLASGRRAWPPSRDATPVEGSYLVSRNSPFDNDPRNQEQWPGLTGCSMGDPW